MEKMVFGIAHEIGKVPADVFRHGRLTLRAPILTFAP